MPPQSSDLAPPLLTPRTHIQERKCCLNVEHYDYKVIIEFYLKTSPFLFLSRENLQSLSLSVTVECKFTQVEFEEARWALTWYMSFQQLGTASSGVACPDLIKERSPQFTHNVDTVRTSGFSASSWSVWCLTSCWLCLLAARGSCWLG